MRRAHSKGLLLAESSLLMHLSIRSGIFLAVAFRRVERSEFGGSLVLADAAHVDLDVLAVGYPL